MNFDINLISEIAKLNIDENDRDKIINEIKEILEFIESFEKGNY